MPTNIRENGFETLIVNWLTRHNGYEQGYMSAYNVIYAVDEERLFRFLKDTQGDKLEELHILDSDLEKERFCDILPPLTLRLEVGASYSMSLTEQVSVNYPRVSRGSVYCNLVPKSITVR